MHDSVLQDPTRITIDILLLLLLLFMIDRNGRMRMEAGRNPSRVVEWAVSNMSKMNGPCMLCCLAIQQGVSQL